MVFSVMPSSAPVERVFSVTGRVKNKRRAQLSHDSLECLTLINMNHDVIEEIKSSKVIGIEKLEMPSVNFEVTSTREDDLRLEEVEDLVEEDLDEEEVHEDNQDIDDEEEVQEENQD